MSAEKEKKYQKVVDECGRLFFYKACNKTATGPKLRVENPGEIEQNWPYFD
jgi:hypothetical protein